MVAESATIATPAVASTTPSVGRVLGFLKGLKHPPPTDGGFYMDLGILEIRILCVDWVLGSRYRLPEDDRIKKERG